MFYLITERASSNLQDLLTEQLEKGELLSPKFVFNILSQIIEGLSALHDADIVHGNLKASNILIFGAGDEITVKLTDHDGFPGASADHSSNLLLIDTRLIQSPEYLEDEVFDKNGDIWQLGLILFQMLTLEPLFSAKTESKLMKQIDNLGIEVEIQQIHDDFEVFKQLIQRMIVVEPEQRCTLDDVLNQIQQIDDHTLSDVNLTYI